MSADMLIQRAMLTRKGQRQVAGLFVGMVIDKTVRTGWSRVNFHAGDKFNMIDAKNVAHTHLLHRIPVAPMANAQRNADFLMQYIAFLERCNRYFKVAFVSEMATEAPAEDPVVASVMQSFKASLPPVVNLDDKLLHEFVVPFIKMGRVLEGSGIPMFGGEVNLNSVVQPANTIEQRQGTFDKMVAMAVASGLKVPAWLLTAVAEHPSDKLVDNPVEAAMTVTAKYIRDAKGRFASLFSVKQSKEPVQA